MLGIQLSIYYSWWCWRDSLVMLLVKIILALKEAKIIHSDPKCTTLWLMVFLGSVKTFGVQKAWQWRCSIATLFRAFFFNWSNPLNWIQAFAFILIHRHLDWEKVKSLDLEKATFTKWKTASSHTSFWQDIFNLSRDLSKYHNIKQ